MEFLDLNLTSGAENLALDESLLDAAEAGEGPTEILRLWESPTPMVVLGRTSQIDKEVHAEFCEREGIPILRRPSGGASVLAGPGCLMYAVVLSYEQRPELRPLDKAHAFVLDRLAEAVRSLVDDSQRSILAQAEPLGTSDLVIGQRKFSGNSLRCKRTHFLYHGTVLYDFALGLITQCLQQPPRQPEYRQDRKHQEFLMNLPVDGASLCAALQSTWKANSQTEEWPRGRVADLVSKRYSQAAWNRER